MKVFVRVAFRWLASFSSFVRVAYCFQKLKAEHLSALVPCPLCASNGRHYMKLLCM
jgi:hypothetical protein